MTGDVLGFVLVGFLTLVGTAYTARSARRTNTVTVDVRIFEALQEDVVRLQDRVELLRNSVRAAQDETDRERNRRRSIEAQVEALTDLVESMTRKMHASGLEPDPRATAFLGFPRPPDG